MSGGGREGWPIGSHGEDGSERLDSGFFCRMLWEGSRDLCFMLSLLSVYSFELRIPELQQERARDGQCLSCYLSAKSYVMLLNR